LPVSCHRQAVGKEQRVAGEQFCEVGRGITLCYERLGDPEAPTVLLLAGLGQQLLMWSDDFCSSLVERGFEVVRFDNRDCGRSTHPAIPAPSPFRIATRRFSARQYDLGDMAADAAGLTEALGLAPVHVVGASMGGMIGQTLAARHPELVETLTSIMSNTGRRRIGQPAWSTYRLLLSRPATEREAYADAAVRIFRHIGSRGFPFDEGYTRELALRSFDRGHQPAGTLRQLGAIVCSGDRTHELGSIRAPTLVIHGDHDPMVDPSGGRVTAAAIPGARLETIAGLGHDLPAALRPRLVELIANHAAAARSPEAAGGVGTGA
jgi:pimeloyl-ACP methyl ester carboxylesterase